MTTEQTKHLHLMQISFLYAVSDIDVIIPHIAAWNVKQKLFMDYIKMAEIDSMKDYLVIALQCGWLTENEDREITKFLNANGIKRKSVYDFKVKGEKKK